MAVVQLSQTAEPKDCGPRASGMHIRQIPHAYVTTITCILIFTCKAGKLNFFENCHMQGFMVRNDTNDMSVNNLHTWKLLWLQTNCLQVCILVVYPTLYT